MQEEEIWILYDKTLGSRLISQQNGNGDKKREWGSYLEQSEKIIILPSDREVTPKGSMGKNWINKIKGVVNKQQKYMKEWLL